MTDHRVLSSGALPDGRTVEVLEDYDAPGYANRFEVRIAGDIVEVLHASRLRDGGTTTIETTAGVLRMPRKLSREPGPDTLDGVVYALPLSPEQRAKDDEARLALLRVADAEAGRPPRDEHRPGFGLFQTTLSRDWL